MTPLADASAEIVARVVEQRRRTAERRRRVDALRRLDALLADLEELNLEGRSRIPDALHARLVALAVGLGDARLRSVRPRTTIVHVMDQLDALQSRLISARACRQSGGGATA